MPLLFTFRPVSIYGRKLSVDAVCIRPTGTCSDLPSPYVPCVPRGTVYVLCMFVPTILTPKWGRRGEGGKKQGKVWGVWGLYSRVGLEAGSSPENSMQYVNMYVCTTQ